jgi:hypothetical protein
LINITKFMTVAKKKTLFQPCLNASRFINTTLIMKKKFTPEAIIVAAILVVAVFSTCDFRNYQRFDAEPLAEPVEPPFLNDSLPHWRYKAITDSFRRVNLSYNNAVHSFSTSTIGYSVFKNARNDKTGDDEKEYFLSLGGYRMKPDAHFVIENGKGLVKYAVWDTVKGDYRIGHTATKPTTVRFAKDLVKTDGRGSVLLPLDPGTYRLAKILIWSLFIILTAIFIWAMLVVPVRILTRLGGKNSFNAQNTRGLYIMAIAAFAIYFIPLLLAGLSKLFFSGLIPPEMHFNWMENIAKGEGWLLAGLVLLLIARAFKRGEELIEEQALYP